MSLSEEKIKELVAEAAAEAVKPIADAALCHSDIHLIVSQAVEETFLRLGIDAKNPIEMQKDFQHVRQWRKTGEEVKTKTLLTLLGLVITGLGTIVVLGLKSFFK